MTSTPFSRPLLLAGCFVASGLVSSLGGAPALPESTVAFIDRHCSTCHNDVDKEGGLDLTALTYVPANAANFLAWVKVHDRVQLGEMPPKEKKRPAATDAAAFLTGLGSALGEHERQMLAREGRATRRRLNRYEYENVLQDLLAAPWLQVKDLLPEDGEAHGYNRIGDVLDVSHVHLARYMDAANAALRQVLAVQSERLPATKARYYVRDESMLSGARKFLSVYTVDSPDQPERRHFPLLDGKPQPEVRRMTAPVTVGDSDPDVRNREAVGWLHSNYVIGYSSPWRNFAAPVTAKYRMRFAGYTTWIGPYGFRIDFSNASVAKPEGQREPNKWFLPNFDDLSPGRTDEPIVIYSGGALARQLGSFDLLPTPGVFELEPVWLLAGENIITDAQRFVRTRPPPTRRKGMTTNPLSQRDGMPAVAFQWMEVEGPLYDEHADAGYRLLFGDLPLKKVVAREPESEAAANTGRGRGGRGGRGRARPEPTYEITTANPQAEAERLLRAFIGRAYRRPAEEDDLQLFLRLFDEHFTGLKFSFVDAMIATYTAVLASPAYIYIDEKPGKLDDLAVATRLALFLWNSEPDAALKARAAKGELQRPEVLRAETERLLADPKSQRFVDAFLDYWLDLRKMQETTPDSGLYNDYYLDDSLAEAAVAETKLFFRELLEQDLPARNIVAADFTFINERLATHYGIKGVEGVAMRRIDLPRGSVRGGFMTQASVLKVTANGTTTSPVKRGQWVMERMLGFEVPPPPAAVPAVEPDIRGAATIRQQLDKHRADESCALCHRKIDPAGLALESFDVFGGWRDRYRAVATDKEPEVGFGKNAWPFVFHHALPVESHGELADGRAFRDVRDLKRLLLADEEQVARNFIRQLATYATGAPVRFSERAAIERILQATKSSDHGLGSILHAIVQSELFLNK